MAQSVSVRQVCQHVFREVGQSRLLVFKFKKFNWTKGAESFLTLIMNPTVIMHSRGKNSISISISIPFLECSKEYLY